MNYLVTKTALDGNIVLSKCKRSKIATALFICDTEQNNRLPAFYYQIRRRKNGQVLRKGLCPLTERYANLIRVSIIDSL